MEDNIDYRYDVFISYRRDPDFYLAETIKGRLEQRHCKVFLDTHELHAGQLFPERLRQAIKESGSVVLIMTSRAALERCSSPGDWVAEEISIALENNKNIIPIIGAGKIDYPEDFPERLSKLRDYNGIELIPNYIDQAMDRLLSAIWASKPIGQLYKTDGLLLRWGEKLLYVQSKETVSLGSRAGKADLVVRHGAGSLPATEWPNATVSSVQAEICYGDDNVSLINKSRYGTYVNGIKVTTEELPVGNGALVGFGNVEMRCTLQHCHRGHDGRMCASCPGKDIKSMVLTYKETEQKEYLLLVWQDCDLGAEFRELSGWNLYRRQGVYILGTPDGKLQHIAPGGRLEYGGQMLIVDYLKFENVPEHVNDTVMKALAKDSKERFGSSVELKGVLSAEQLKKGGGRKWLAYVACIAVVLSFWGGYVWHKEKRLLEGDIWQGRRAGAQNPAEKLLPRDVEKAREHGMATNHGEGEVLLALARGAKSRLDWQSCAMYASAVLKLDGENAEALTLAAEAENHLEPMLDIHAMVNDMRVPAKVKFDDGEWQDTMRRFKGFQKGVCTTVVLSYKSDVDEYEGELLLTCDWQGMKTVTVDLRKISFPHKVQLPEGMYLEMVKVYAGKFKMGSPIMEEGRYNDEKLHIVKLTQDFWLGKYEVTQAQWEAVMKTDIHAQNEKSNNKGLYGVGASHPMYHVTWEEAKKFCEELNRLHADKLPHGYRFGLPTEAQWEYACRAGTKSALYTGDIKIIGKNNAPALDLIAWYGGNSSVDFNGNGVDTSDWPEKQYPNGCAGTHKVGMKEPNSWGLYDMLGNVYEWCEDVYDSPYGEGTEVDPLVIKGKYKERVIRGGSWGNYARLCRSALRKYNKPDNRDAIVGFRLALRPIH